MPNLSSILPPNNIVTSENEATLTNKTLTDPIIQYVAGDTSFTVPSGTTGERPSSPGIGELRFNTDSGGLEQYDGTNWGAVVPDDLDINTLSINGTQVVDSSGNIDTASVSINGELLSDGNSIKIPTGTTAERPASPVAGDLRFNTDLNLLEQYDGTEWSSVTPDLVLTPENIAPADNATDTLLTPELDASAYRSLYGVPMASAQWQISEVSDFSTTVVDETVAGTSTTFTPSSNLNTLTNYYWRVRYTDDDGNVSDFSDAAEFTTANIFTDQPTITSPTDGETDIAEQPVIESSAFNTVNGSDTHVASQWVITRVSDGVDVFDSGEDTSNLESIQVPAGVLDEGQVNYTVKVRHKGNTYGFSAYSPEITFTTAASFFPEYPSGIGEPAEGGFFAGRIDIGGTIYNLIVAPKASGESQLAYGSQGLTSFGDSSTNGGSNTAILVNSSSSTDFPAAHFCNDLTIGGYSDWYMPAKNELEVLYYWLKPTTGTNNVNSGGNPDAVSPEPINTNYTSSDPGQTSASIFQDGNSEAFDTNFYFSSTESDTDTAWIQRFTDGLQDFNGFKDSVDSVRAVRKIPV